MASELEREYRYGEVALKEGYWWQIAKHAKSLAYELRDIGGGGPKTRSAEGLRFTSLRDFVELDLVVDEAQDRLDRRPRAQTGPEWAFGIHDHSEEMHGALERMHEVSPVSRPDLRHLGRHGSNLTWGLVRIDEASEEQRTDLLRHGEDLDEDDRIIIGKWNQWLDPSQELIEIPTADGVLRLPEDAGKLREATIDLFRWTVLSIWPPMEEPEDWPRTTALGPN